MKLRIRVKKKSGKSRHLEVQADYHCKSVAGDLFPLILGKQLQTGEDAMEILKAMRLPNYANVVAAMRGFGLIEGTPDEWIISKKVHEEVLARLQPGIRTRFPEPQSHRHEVFTPTPIQTLVREWKHRLKKTKTVKSRPPSNLIVSFKRMCRRYQPDAILAAIPAFFQNQPAVVDYSLEAFEKRADNGLIPKEHLKRKARN